MNEKRFAEITGLYRHLGIAVLGDFCLDRYLEIDPTKEELSIETGLPVHNVINVRAQPGGAGTIVNNLAALGIGRIYPIGFVGEDGEGYELWKALEACPGAHLDLFIKTIQRRTFTYTKPLLVRVPNPLSPSLSPGEREQTPPIELNRFDLKNWTPTPALLQGLIVSRLLEVVATVGALIVLDQVNIPETGVVSQRVLKALNEISHQQPDLPVLADSRRGLREFPPLILKMNAMELASLDQTETEPSLEKIREAAVSLASKTLRNVFVTLAQRGLLAATPNGETEHLTALPVRGPIDVVGAGDAVSANIIAALCAGATLRETLEMANAAASVVIHKLGTTGTASVTEIAERLLE